MKTLEIHCPRCQSACELFIGHEAQIVILNCPSCSTPLMYYYGETFEVDESDFKYMKGKRQLKEMPGFLKAQPSGSQTLPVPVASVELEERRHERIEIQPRHKVGAPVRESSFTGDDILNLRIDLARAQDVMDFIRSQL